MRIVIVGCGRVGSGLSQTLAAGGHAITVIDKDPLAFEKLGRKFTGRTIVGVGFDRDVLLSAGIDHADGLAAVTASDEANVVTIRIAREVFHVPRVVARLYDTRQAEIYSRLGLQTIAPASWGINRIADLLLYSPLEAVFTIGSGDVEIVATEVPYLLVGKTVRDLTIASEIHVVSITRANRTFLPTLGTIFQAGDMLHLAALITATERLKQLLGY